MIFVISYICVGQLRHIFVRFFFLDGRGKNVSEKLLALGHFPDLNDIGK